MSELYDMIIVGGGPAGLTAAIYAGRARLKTLLLEKGSIGGNAANTREIVNYPGFPRVSGTELTELFARQAEAFGVEIKRGAVTALDLEGEEKLVTVRRTQYRAKTVVLATGTQPRILGIPGEKELRGQGVAYCATCDAEFFQDQHVVVLGSSDQAIEEGMFIARFASQVTVVVLHDEGVLDCNKLAAEQAFRHPKLRFVWNSTLSAVEGENEVSGVCLKNIKTGEEKFLACSGVFFFVGMIPQSDLLREQLPLNARGYVETDSRMQAGPAGVYAAGDLREKYLRQVSTAIGDGAAAASAAQQYLQQQEDFRCQVLDSDQPVWLCFWSPQFPEGLQRIAALQADGSHRIVEVDVSRQSDLATRYHIDLTARQPFRALEFKKGQVTAQC